MNWYLQPAALHEAQRVLTPLRQLLVEILLGDEALPPHGTRMMRTCSATGSISGWSSNRRVQMSTS